jgi:hypothetical protein
MSRTAKGKPQRLPLFCGRVSSESRCYYDGQTDRQRWSPLNVANAANDSCSWAQLWERDGAPNSDWELGVRTNFPNNHLLILSALAPWSGVIAA